MSVNSFGALARGFQMRAQHGRLKSEVELLVKEVSTGRTADVARHVRGDFLPIAAIEREMNKLAAFRIANAEAASFAEAAQTNLGRISDIIAGFGPKLLAASSADSAGLVRINGPDAEAEFATVVAALNARFADRALFAGTSTDRAALNPADQILAAFRSAVSSETTAAGIAAIADTWFGPAGTFETLHYSGNPQQLAPVGVGTGQSVALSVTAADPRLREILKGLALAALLHEGPVVANALETRDLARRAGEAILTAQSALSSVRADIGVSEAQIERATVRNQAEISALELAQAGLLSKDSFVAASRLEEAQRQLEVLYSVTARTSRLSLADFLQ